MDDRTYADASTANGTGPLDTLTSNDGDPAASTADAESSASTSLRPMFLSELAGAMHAAAARERERIAEVMSDDAATHVEKTRARGEIETAELRRLADDDVSRIEEWSTSETKRIRSEATQRISERKANLADYLRQHDAIIAAEVGAVEAAIDEYGATLDAFFAGLSNSADPSEIVRRAEQLPALPDLDAARATARGDAVGRYAAVSDDAGPETAVTVEGEPVAVESAGSAESGEGETTAMAEPAGTAEPETTATADADPLIGDTVTDEASSAVSWAAPEATVESTSEATVEATAEQANGWGEIGDDAVRASDPQPAVGVMDPPSAAAENGWGTEEPVAVGAPVDHTSAAVRLLRSVAPWTAPNHDGDHQRPTDQG